MKIEKIGFGGVGIATFFDGKKIVIKGGVLPGSVVDCRVIKEKKDYIECQLVGYRVLKIEKSEEDLKKSEEIGFNHRRFVEYITDNGGKITDNLRNDLQVVDSQTPGSTGSRGLRDANLCPHNMIWEYFGKKGIDVGCGGCKWQILPYPRQLELKQQIIEDSFRFIWDYVKDKLQTILPSPLVNGYRNKVEFSVGGRITEDGEEKITEDEEKITEDNVRSQKIGEEIKSEENLKKSGRNESQATSPSIVCDNNEDSLGFLDIIIGFHKQGRWDRIVDVRHCDLISEQANKIYSYMRQLLKSSNLPPYNQKTHQGILRHLVLRQGFSTGDFMLNLVVANENNLAKLHWSKFENLVEQIKNDKFLKQNVKTFLLTFNNDFADVVKGKDIKTQILRGDGVVQEILNIAGQKVRFQIGPFSFFQTNTKGAELLFNKALEIIKKFGKEKYHFGLDLYCGAGTIGISYLKAGLFDYLIGIEIVEEAIQNAKLNLKLNNIPPDIAYFVAGKAEKLIYQDNFLKQNLNKIDLIIVDPPRDGLHKDVVKFLLDLKSKIDFYLLYISCNPVTLARDIALLKEKFKLQTIQPVDMFPHTHHIENISFMM